MKFCFYRLPLFWQSLYEAGKCHKITLLDLYCEALRPELYYSRGSDHQLGLEKHFRVPSSDQSVHGQRSSLHKGSVIHQAISKVRYVMEIYSRLWTNFFLLTLSDLIVSPGRLATSFFCNLVTFIMYLSITTTLNSTEQRLLCKRWSIKTCVHEYTVLPLADSSRAFFSELRRLLPSPMCFYLIDASRIR